MELESLYFEFLEFLKENYIKESRNWTGVEKNVKLSTLEKSFVHQKITFFEFCSILRDLFYYKRFLFEKNQNLDIWVSKILLKFLLKKEAAFVKNNKIFLKGFPDIFLRRRNENEIIEVLNKKMKINKKLTFIENLIGKERFKWKKDYDQIPISFSSSVFIASKIFDYFPVKKRLLLVGDDDFNSVILSFLEPNIQITVVDIDAEVLETIERIKKKYSLENISTEKCDVRYSKPKKDFSGFVINPPYTISGVKTFFNFGDKAIKEGLAFLIVGNESIKNRFLLLQKFFNSKNFIIREITNGRISYPFRGIFKEDISDKKELEKLGLKIEGDYIFASFYVLEKIPWRIKNNEEKEIYNYL
jgi:hypothetical protein